MFVTLTLATYKTPIAIHLDQIGEVRSLQGRAMWNYETSGRTQITARQSRRTKWFVMEDYAEVMRRIADAGGPGRLETRSGMVSDDASRPW